MCQINGAKKLVQQWYNRGRSTPSLLSTSNPRIGLSNESISINNGMLNCLVTRQKSNATFSISTKDVNNYFDISSTPYNLLVAYGSNDGSGKFLLQKVNLS